MTRSRRSRRSFLRAELLLAAGTLTVALVLAELGFRALLFSEVPLPAKLRDPWLYADYFSEDDFWILQHIFEAGPSPPTDPHPLLGWIGRFSGESYLHDRSVELADRRPVLLYGDSFSQCVGDVECFEDILNADGDFSERHFLLNYGVGGYGLGQIYLLLERSVDQYQDPFVVVGLMTLDLDRTILSVRTGQKPRFVATDGALRLTGVPIDPDPEDFFARRPPTIRSYLARLFTRTLARVVPALGRDPGSEAEKKMVNGLILAEIEALLRARDLDHLFVIFHPQWNGVSSLNDSSDWRDTFLRNLMEERDLPYVWTKDLLREDRQARGGSWNDFIDRNNGHPTTRYNELVAAAIRAHLLSRSRAGDTASGVEALARAAGD